MQISLIKHGPVNIAAPPMTAAAFFVWVEQYKQAELRRDEAIPPITSDVICHAKRLVTSDAKCAIQSASAVTNSLAFTQNSLFREVPISNRLFAPHWVRLKPMLWMKLGRMLWLTGYSDTAESYSQAEQRARQAADLLIGYAHCDQRIALIGHPYFHFLLANELKRRGWIGPAWLDNRDWGCTTYRYRKVFIGKPIEGRMGITST